MARWKLLLGDGLLTLRKPRVWIALLAIAGALFATRGWWRPGGGIHAFVSDELGTRLVEGHAAEIEAASAEMGVDPHLMAAIMFCESRGRVEAVSSAGALGLMQLSLAAAGDAARKLGEPVPGRDELLGDARLNVRLGARHLRWLFDHRGEWNLEQILVSYNAGRARLFQWIEEAGGWSAWRKRELAKIQAGEEHNGALLYALRVIEMRAFFAERGNIENRTGIVAS